MAISTTSLCEEPTRGGAWGGWRRDTCFWIEVILLACCRVITELVVIRQETGEDGLLQRVAPQASNERSSLEQKSKGRRGRLQTGLQQRPT